MASFMERLRAAREKRGLSQRELAARCGLGVNQINRYENGTNVPSVSVLMTLAHELNASFDYLLGVKDETHGVLEPAEMDVNEREVMDTFHREGWLGLIRLSTEKLSG